MTVKPVLTAPALVRGALFGAVTALFATGAVAQSSGSVSWSSPANGATFDVGTVVNPSGLASISGVVGGDLDLVLALDSSGSMRTTVNIPGNPTRRELQAQAANALVASLPAGTNIGIVDFDSNAFVAQSLIGIPGGTGALTTAINGIDATGGTDIRDGIVFADNELDANGRAGASKQILVISDGGSSQSIAVAAAKAAAADGYQVNAVSFPGGDIRVLEAVAAAGNGAFVNFNSSPQNIIDIFSGSQGGVLAGVDRVEITDPNGSMFDATVTALGGFDAFDFSLKLGANTWTATAFFDDNTTANASLTLFGRDSGMLPPVGQVPLPAPALLLIGGLAALGWTKRRS